MSGKIETLSLRIECGEVIEMLKKSAVLAGYEVTLPGGNILIYGLHDEGVVNTFVEQLGQDAVEPLYKFGESKPNVNHPDLFESSPE